MSEKTEKLNNIKSQTVTKNVRLNEHTEGESLPLATAADASSATPSPRGSAPKTPVARNKNRKPTVLRIRCK